MAEATEEVKVEPAVEPVKTEPVVIPPAKEEPFLVAPTEIDLALGDDDKEPGGNDPQAVRARKEYRARKRFETELRAEREARIAAESRAKALAEASRAAPAAPERRYTPAELQQAVDAGTITGIEAADYLARINAEDVGARIVRSERVRYDTETRRGGAIDIVRQYTTELPWLNDPHDSRTQRVQAEYNRLTDPNGLYRMPQEPSTDIIVLEKMVGTLDKLRKGKEVTQRNDMHVENGAGGTGGKAPAGAKPATDKMPAHFQTYWEKTNTPQADREKEAERYFKRQAERAAASR